MKAAAANFEGERNGLLQKIDEAKKASEGELRLKVVALETELAKAGVKVALGSDAGVFPHGTQGREFVLMVEHGLSPMKAIEAGTRGAAELLGLAGELGTVEAGRIADLVAVAGDPLADIEVLTRPVFVLHEGRVARDDIQAGAAGR